VGFGVDDHLLRGLMRFIEMTSREYTLEDVILNRGGPKLQMWMVSRSKEV
jgi:hypothetical protein